MDDVAAHPRQPPVRSVLYFLLVPLLGCHLYEPESLPKLLVCAGAIVLLNGWILWGAKEKSLPWPKGWAPWAMLAFGAVTILQSFRATNTYLAVVELTLNLGGVAIALALASSAPMRAFLIRCLPATTLVVAFVLAAVGICQWNRFTPTACMWIGPWMPQVPSLFANGNYAGTFVAMVLPLLLVGTLIARTTPKVFLWGGAVGALSAYLMLSQSRAGAVAALVTLLGVGGVMLVRRPTVERLAVKVTVFVVSIAAGVLLSTAGDSAKTETWTKHVGATGSGATRIEIWKTSLRLIAANPVLGVGVGNFRPAYHEFRDPAELGSHALQDPNNGFFAMGNPHNNALHVMAEMGPVGLASVLLVVVLAIAVFWRASRDRRDDLWMYGMVGVVVAFLIGGFFNSISNRAAHMAYVWMALGYLLGQRDEAHVLRDRLLVGVLVAFGAVAAFFAVAAVVHVGYVVSRDRDVNFIVGGRVKIDLVDQAVRYHPWNFHQRLRYGAFFLERGDGARAEREHAAVLTWEPKNPYVLLRMGDVRRIQKRFDDAKEFYARSQEAAPQWALPRLGLAQLDLDRGNFEDADRAIAALLVTNPSWPDAEFSMALVRGGQGRHAEAVELLSRLAASGTPIEKMLASRKEPWLQRDEYRAFKRP